MIIDKRTDKLAEIVMDHSLGVKKNDGALLIVAEKAFEEYANVFAKAAENRGLKVVFELEELDLKKKLIEENSIKDFEKEGKRLEKLALDANYILRVFAESNPLYMKDVDSEKIANYQKYSWQKFVDVMINKRWNVVACPCESQAKEAEMTLEEFADFVYSATNINWIAEREKMKKIKEAFDPGKSVRVIANNTDLTFSIDGRSGMISDGTRNMPSGEVFYGPVEDSTEGYIYFPYKNTLQGKSIQGIRLEFRDGAVVACSAETNEDHLLKMLDMKGMKRLGEFGIGSNPAITKYMNNILFDEKIKGTVHFALGKSLRDVSLPGGGKNEAEFHWDLICDLRDGGMILVDGKIVQENGKWIWEK